MQQQKFLAKLIFKLSNQEQDCVQFFEEYYFPLTAATEKEAYQTALIKASSELDHRQNYTKDTVQWEFIGMESLHTTEEMLPSSVQRTSIEPEVNLVYIQSLKQRNAAIQLRLTETA